mmetsp:Transcript_13383/g.34098  ORF Transcript_13383/g.34098 Transcript_13383/m.34098 type:complete len:217 (+) Transcript_13383:213-863(+)
MARVAACLNSGGKAEARLRPKTRPALGEGGGCRARRARATAGARRGAPDRVRRARPPSMRARTARRGEKPAQGVAEVALVAEVHLSRARATRERGIASQRSAALGWLRACQSPEAFLPPSPLPSKQARQPQVRRATASQSPNLGGARQAAFSRADFSAVYSSRTPRGSGAYLAIPPAHHPARGAQASRPPPSHRRHAPNRYPTSHSQPPHPLRCPT